MNKISILTAARIARSHGIEIDRYTLEREIIPSMNAANLVVGDPRNLRRWTPAVWMHHYMASLAYECGGESHANKGA